MKHLWFILLFAASGFAVQAQTNAPPVEPLNVHSDTGGFDMKHHLATYSGHVRVDDPQMKLTCEWLAANVPHDSNPDRHILALTNVVIDLNADKEKPDDTNKLWHVTSDQAVYNFHREAGVTNETVTISGHAVAKSTDETVTGEPLVYDLNTKLFSGSDYKTVFNTSAFKVNGTNSAAGKTNGFSFP